MNDTRKKNLIATSDSVAMKKLCGETVQFDPETTLPVLPKDHSPAKNVKEWVNKFGVRQ